MRVDLIRLVAVSGAVATAMLTSHPIGPISAQSLAAPTFTAAQQNAGDAIYKESCASCHGKNLDDGEFGPPLKGVEFRSAWFGRPAGVLFTTIETMPPAAPGSLGAENEWLLPTTPWYATAKPTVTAPITMSRRSGRRRRCR